MYRAVTILGLIIGLGAVALQFALTIPAALNAGRTLAGAIVFYLSFFTILTNIAVVTVYGAALLPMNGERAAFLARPSVRAGVVVAIAVVCLVYLAILSPLWQPQGLFWLADILLHYVAPILFILWWLIFAADGTIGWRDIPSWLVYPLAYLVYVLARAAIVGEVPYPFLNTATNGRVGVLLSVVGILVLFVVLGTLTVLADHQIAALKRRSHRIGQ